MSNSDLTNQEKLEEIYRLVHENNTILHGMRSRERIANALRILYWVIIIGSLFGAYYYVKPLVDVVLSNKGKVEDTLNQFEQIRSQFPELKAFQNILNEIKGKNGKADPSATTTE